jgi:tetratricopeptide (TPR) repeat protein
MRVNAESALCAHLGHECGPPSVVCQPVVSISRATEYVCGSVRHEAVIDPDRIQAPIVGRSDSDKLRVFISYSRDDLDFADQLDIALRLQGFATSIDRHAISGGEEWKQRLGNLIREGDTVVFVLSPSSAGSDMCAWEVEEAARLGKRIVPVACGPLGQSIPPPRLRDLNYIFFYSEPKTPGSGFGAGLAELTSALNTDLEWLREHTRYLLRAIEWEGGGRTENRLLSGSDITAAKAWAARRPKDAPEPTPLHYDFIRASEDAEDARLNAQRKQLAEMAAAQEERAKALQEAEEANRQREEAIARERVSERLAREKAEDAARAAEALASAAKRTTRRTLIGLVATLIFSSLAAVLGWQVIQQQKAAESQRISEETERAVGSESLSETSRTLLEVGNTAQALQSAKDALRLSQALASRNPKNAAQQHDVATSHLRYGDVLRAAGMHLEALSEYDEALNLQQSMLGPSHPDIAQSLIRKASLLTFLGRYAEAEPLQKRALIIRQAAIGASHPFVARSLEELAELYLALARFSEAEALHKQALSIRETALGPDDPEVARSLIALGRLYRAEGRLAEAEPLTQRALTIYDRSWGSDSSYVATALNALGEIYAAQGRFSEAEPVYQRALAIREKTLGPDNPELGQSLNNLALLYHNQGRYNVAEPQYKRSLAIDEKAFGPDHATVAAALNNLAALYNDQGRYAEAEPRFKRAIAIADKALGPDHPLVGSCLNNLADLYRVESRFDEAEPFYKRALAIREKALGSDHPDVGASLNSLADLYRVENRLAEAEPLYKRALAIREKALGVYHPDTGSSIDNLAELYQAEGRLQEAEPLYKRALAIREKALGPDHPAVGSSLDNLGDLYRIENRFAEAEPLYKRALAIRETALGPDHPAIGSSLNNLGDLYRAENRFAEAEPLYKRALAIDEKAFGPDHADVGKVLNSLATLSYFQGDWMRSIDFWRRSTSLTIRRAQRGTLVGEALTGKRTSETAQKSSEFGELVKAVYRLPPAQRDEARLPREMFQTAQWAQSSEAAESLTQMAARGAKGDPKLAGFVRERQDLVAEWQKRDQLRSAAVAQAPDKRNREVEAENNTRLAAIDARIAMIDKALAANFPDYAALGSPVPLSVEDVQRDLAADEALVLFLDTPEMNQTPEETFLWVVTKTDVRWVRTGVDTSALTHEVAALRCGLAYDPGFWEKTHCSDLLNVTYTKTDYYALGKPLPFDLARAHALYNALFGPVEELIRDRHLLIVPSGSLMQLPFAVLVTRPSKVALPTSLLDYRVAAWLTRGHAITMLPSVSSLKALRGFTKASTAGEPYIGFGNPLLDGEPEKFKDDALAAKLAREKRCEAEVTTQNAVAASQEPASAAEATVDIPSAKTDVSVADVAYIRRWVPVPETADELCEVARSLGVDAINVHLGARATESEVKRLSANGTLEKFKIIHFATHAAGAGDISRASEPGLILTPPIKASETDDGLLTVSEIANLRLNADWVILSASNTLSVDFEQAFFYAGARSLLASQWEGSSEGMIDLVVKAIAELKSNANIGRAEALRRSMLAMIDTGKAYEAHPAFWAQFVVVGEGS